MTVRRNHLQCTQSTQQLVKNGVSVRFPSWAELYVRWTMTGDQINAGGEGTAVITAFLWDGRRVLLALRSEQVSTFPGHWAGVSGYLEGEDPAAWALVEIEEELGLSREHVTLRRIGDPLEAAGVSADRVFVVHPFLFSVEEGTTVRGDWEAKRLEWVPARWLAVQAPRWSSWLGFVAIRSLPSAGRNCGRRWTHCAVSDRQ